MAKKLVFDYTFDASAQTVTLTDDVYPKRRLLMITNVTSGDIIYLFNDAAKSGTFTFNYEDYSTTITLDYDTTSMADTDDLQIFVEWDNQTVEFDESYVDPVSKIRVSQPENLIDTDFEYGLQSTKWETLELTKNIPTFYSRNGDLSFELNDITVQQGSNTVTVVTTNAHGLQRGTPILIQGTSSSLCDGGFTSLSVVDDNTFTYQAKSNLGFSGSIKTTNTEVFQGSIYSGTEFKIRSIAGIVSDGVSEGSTLTVTTEYPTDFVTGTQFALTNSFASSGVSFDTDDVEPDNLETVTTTVTVGYVSSEASDNTNISNSTITPYNWVGTSTRSIYIDPNDVSVSNGDIVFSGSGHGRYTGDNTFDIFAFYYNLPTYTSNKYTTIGGLVRGRMYIGRYINATTLRIWNRSEYANALNNSTTGRVTVTSIPTRQNFKHQFLAGTMMENSTRSDYFYNYTNLSNIYDWNYPTVAFTNTLTTSDNAFDNGATLGRHLIMSEDTTTSGVDGGGKFTFGSGGVVGNFESLATSDTRIFLVRDAGYFYVFPSVNGSSRMSLDTVVNTDIIVPITLNPNRNTIYLQNHGYATGDSVTYNLINGIGQFGLTSGNTYTVEKVSNDRFRLLSGSSEVNFTSFAEAGDQFTLTATKYKDNGDTVLVEDSTFQEGDAILYDSNNGNAIGGLTDGETYYVYRKSGDRFRLASDSQLVTGNIVRASATSYLLSTSYFRTDNTIQNRVSFSGYEEYNVTNFTTGSAVLYSQSSGLPAGGLKNGGIYYINKISNTQFSLHYTKADALADTNRITITPPTNYPSFTETYAIDLTSKPSQNETHNFSSSFVGAADGNYSLSSTAADQMSFTLSSNATIKGRKIETTIQRSLLSSTDSFYYPSHGFSLGADVVYTSTTTNLTGLTSGTTYYVIPLDRDRFQLAASSSDATEGTNISLTGPSSGVTAAITDSITFQGNSIVAAATGSGTVSVSGDSKVLIGDGTLFNSIFKPGDTIKVTPPITEHFYNSNSSANYIQLYTPDGALLTTHGLSTGDPIRFTGTSFPTNVNDTDIFYIRATSTTRFTLYRSEADAVAGNVNFLSLNGLGVSSARKIVKLDSEDKPIERTIDYVNSNTQLEVTENYEDSITGGDYFISSQLLLRPDGFALHRPYDGGVELIPPTNPDSQMIRQTRKYFRYQSGKGIQVSFAVNFSPTTQIDEAYYDSSGDLYIKTRFPHRLSAGLEIEVSEATGSSATSFNGTRTVSSIVDDYTAVFDTGVTADANKIISGNAEFYVKSWRNSSLKCGLFDDQNGLFFSYDGDRLFCSRRSSIRQISGTSQVTFRSGDVIGNGTKFQSQLSKGQYIVIKGQSYQITKISSDTLMHITPSYRGVDAAGVIITVTETTSVPQENWNLDKADGTGYTGFKLDLARIQMAYIDYSWYGAGKVRFGFKDQHGKVQYVHEFVHGNFKTEAYMRSGNIPARYEIQNTGNPTYVPALAHWGTSVIMDGRFDDDKAYVFNASGNNITTSGSNSVTFVGEVETLKKYREPKNGNIVLNYAVHVEVPNSQLNAAFNGVEITGAGLASGTKLALPENFNATYYQPYQPSIFSRIYGEGSSTDRTRTLMLIDQPPTSLPTPDPQTGLTTSTYTLDLDVGEGGADAAQVTRSIPLISVRLAPSVDTSTVGKLGEREIINRMQLILSQVSILTTHTCEVKLILNGLLSSNAWQRVTNPSLSELIYHGGNDTISGGAALFSFRAAGDTGTTRSQQLTNQTLGDVATLGNSILGGDQPFPDGPDVLTVVATLTEDPSTVDTTTPFNVSGRISWSESQA